jgi:hypothetical protein
MGDMGSRSAAAKGRTKKSAVKKPPAKKSAVEKLPAKKTTVKKIATQMTAKQGTMRGSRETDVGNLQPKASDIIVGATVMAVKAGISAAASVARNVTGGAKDLLGIRKHVKENSNHSSTDTVADVRQTSAGDASTTRRDDAG